MYGSKKYSLLLSEKSIFKQDFPILNRFDKWCLKRSLPFLKSRIIQMKQNLPYFEPEMTNY